MARDLRTFLAALLLLVAAGAAAAQATVAVLVSRDLLTGRVEKIPLTAAAQPSGHVQWSSGDTVAGDGQVVAFRMGQRVYQATSGKLWTVPMLPGSSGRARLASMDGELVGEIRWKVREDAGDGAVLEANVGVDRAHNGMTGGAASRGSWFARYEGQVPVPVESRVEIRAAGPGGVAGDRSESHLEWLPPEVVAAAVAAPQAQVVHGTLVVQDALTRREKRLPLTSSSDANGTVRWSSGDAIGGDGQVLAVRIGERVYAPREGLLWKLPMAAGASGAAKVVSSDGQASGDLQWTTVAADGGALEVHAVMLINAAGSHANGTPTTRGSWAGRYENPIPLPVRTQTNLRDSAVQQPGTDRSESRLVDWKPPAASTLARP